LEGAGAFWSSATDMTRLVAAALGLFESPLAAPFAAMLDTPRVRNPLGAEQALGWWVWPAHGGMLLNHDGGTAGFAASVFCDPAAQRGVVVLANSTALVSDVARRILRPDESAPAAPAPPSHGLTDAELERLVGVYQAASGARFVIEREGDGLALQAPNAPRLILAPTSDTAFASLAAGLGATFALGPDGRADALAIDFAGRHTDARRLS
jgi:CubicO group peptidase (beta-lactamase class C family)